jgi:hypothetical protein
MHLETVLGSLGERTRIVNIVSPSSRSTGDSPALSEERKIDKNLSQS